MRLQSSMNILTGLSLHELVELLASRLHLKVLRAASTILQLLSLGMLSAPRHACSPVALGRAHWILYQILKCRGRQARM